MQVVAGGLTLNTPEPLEQTVSVEEAIPHENYRETKSAVYNDIGELPPSYTGNPYEQNKMKEHQAAQLQQLCGAVAHGMSIL